MQQSTNTIVSKPSNYLAISLSYFIQMLLQTYKKIKKTILYFHQKKKKIEKS